MIDAFSFHDTWYLIPGKHYEQLQNSAETLTMRVRPLPRSVLIVASKLDQAGVAFLWGTVHVAGVSLTCLPLPQAFDTKKKSVGFTEGHGFDSLSKKATTTVSYANVRCFLVSLCFGYLSVAINSSVAKKTIGLPLSSKTIAVGYTRPRIGASVVIQQQVDLLAPR